VIHTGDCVEVMAAMEPDSIDAIVTDPPYGLEFMGKEWDRLAPTSGNPALRDRSNFTPRKSEFKQGVGTNVGMPQRNPRCRLCGKLKFNKPRFLCVCPAPNFDTRQSEYAFLMQSWHERWATEALRVAKPGAYLLAFGGTRTVHRLTVALEDAGWIIRDVLCWVYASGFPKSKSSLKPAWEPIVLARKPGPLRELAIDACRIGIPAGDRVIGGAQSANGKGEAVNYGAGGYDGTMRENTSGRWPANVVLTDPAFDGGWEGVVGGGETRSRGNVTPTKRERSDGAWAANGSAYGVGPDGPVDPGDTGTYSRFFLIPKASRADREPLVPGELPLDDVFRNHQPDNPKCRTCGRQRIGALGAASCECVEPRWAPIGDRQRRNTHPTVKPTALMRHLIRLVTPKGGRVLDPFLGSGSTAKAAVLEGFDWVGIEREAEYTAILEQRLVELQQGLGL
jgi:site-specific DNA-methyltransferase (adenine-specific)